MGLIGIDEVGRGAWAGPLLVVAARTKKGKKLPTALNDSKLLTKRQREHLAIEIIKSCDIGQGWVSADMIDAMGLANALKSATLLTLLNLDAKSKDKILIDGSVNFIKSTMYINVATKVRADQTEPIVSAASIVAKVLRDQLMSEYGMDYPDYNFAKNVGYGTAGHIKSLDQFGITPLHRKSYKPIRERLLKTNN
ncbi:MAG: ribonuclease HII [bacterium]|nr:ribonuclease HII [bacterium]